MAETPKDLTEQAEPWLEDLEVAGEERDALRGGATADDDEDPTTPIQM